MVSYSLESASNIKSLANVNLFKNQKSNTANVHSTHVDSVRPTSKIIFLQSSIKTCIIRIKPILGIQYTLK